MQNELSQEFRYTEHNNEHHHHPRPPGGPEWLVAVPTSNELQGLVASRIDAQYLQARPGEDSTTSTNFLTPTMPCHHPTPTYNDHRLDHR